MAVDLDEAVELPDVRKYFLMAKSLLATCTEGDCDEVSFVVHEVVDQSSETGASSSGGSTRLVRCVKQSCQWCRGCYVAG